MPRLGKKKREGGAPKPTRPQPQLAPQDLAALGPPPERVLPPTRWSVYEALASHSWQSPEDLTEVVIARCSEQGSVVVAIFLVDLGCLGVKNAFVQRFPAVEGYNALVDALAS